MVGVVVVAVAVVVVVVDLLVCVVVVVSSVVKSSHGSRKGIQDSTESIGRLGVVDCHGGDSQRWSFCVCCCCC